MSSYFTAGFQTGKEKTGKRKGNSLATGEGTERGQQRDKSGKRHRRAGQRPDGTETKTVICRVGSERSLCPVLIVFLETGGRRISWCRIRFRLHWDGGLE